MEQVTANQFREQLKTVVDRAVARHEAVHVTRRRGGDFVVMSYEDFEAEQETLRVLDDEGLISQIRQSLETMRTDSGRIVEPNEL